jgi:uncharacterized membrane protein (UPF0182 family)
MLAIQQPPSGNLPLFLHILGAIATFGATGTMALLGFSSRGREADRVHWLRRLVFRVGIFVLVPAYVLMRAAAQWIDSKEYPHGHEPGWVGVGFLVTDIGAILIIILLVLSWLAARRRESRVAVVVPWLATVYVIALGVAWFAMSAKPGS